MNSSAKNTPYRVSGYDTVSTCTAICLGALQYVLSAKEQYLYSTGTVPVTLPVLLGMMHFQYNSSTDVLKKYVLYYRYRSTM